MASRAREAPRSAAKAAVSAQRRTHAPTLSPRPPGGDSMNARTRLELLSSGNGQQSPVSPLRGLDCPVRAPGEDLRRLPSSPGGARLHWTPRLRARGCFLSGSRWPRWPQPFPGGLSVPCTERRMRSSRPGSCHVSAGDALRASKYPPKDESGGNSPAGASTSIDGRSST